MKVVLSNAAQPTYGVATIPLPIPKAEYDHCIFILNALEIGNQLTADCKVEEISADSPILQRLVGSTINIDELDYLIKRMESFDKREQSIRRLTAQLQCGGNQSRYTPN